MATALEGLIASLTAAVEAATASRPADAASPAYDAGLASANKEIRETAKWMVTSFAAIGGVLVAGLSLSRLGTLTTATPSGRLAATLGGFALALAGVCGAIWFTTRVLTPFPTTLATAEKYPGVVAEAIDRSGVFGEMTFAQLRHAITCADQDLSRAAPDERAAAMAARQTWEPARQVALGLIGSYILAGRFRRARVAIVAGVGLAAVGVALFAWGSNAPAATRSTHPAALAAPLARERVQLTAAGAAAVDVTPGCRRSGVTVVILGGTRARRDVITLPTRRCPSVRLELTPTLGHAP